MQKWRLKFDFENDEIVIDPKVTKLQLLFIKLLRLIKAKNNIGMILDPIRRQLKPLLVYRNKKLLIAKDSIEIEKEEK